MHVNPLPLRLCWLILLAIPLSLFSQTQLEPGDIAVVGLVANRAGCGGLGGEDEVSFVCFKDIEPGTEIDFTDNGWERLNPGQWGNSEGFLRATRTGGVIPAGTVITFHFPPIAGGFMAVAPDADWTFQEFFLPSTNNSINFNSNGDQLYMLQGGNWNVGTGNIGNFGHDAEYIGGRVLFGFNSKADWNSFADDPQDSGLHPDVTPCFNMAPTSGTTDYISFTGPFSPATQLEWISRIRNPDNWTSYPDCPSYQSPPSPLVISASSISLDCAVCRGCAPHDDTLLFNLPLTGSPFDVIYTDGTTNDTIMGIANGAGGLPVNGILDSVTYALVSVTDANGCPVFSNFNGAAEIAVNDPPATNDTLFQLCATGDTAINLNDLDTLVSSEAGAVFAWFEDASGTSPLVDPGAYLVTEDTTVYATATIGVCSSPPVPLSLAIDSFPTLFDSLAFGGCLDGSGSITIDLTALTDSISPTPGVYLTFSTVPLNFTDTIANPQSFTYSSDTTLLVIATDPESGCSSGVGELELVAIPDLNTPGSVFFTLAPNSGCPPLDAQLTLNAPLSGDFEVTYSIGNPTSGYITITDTLGVGQPLDTTLLEATGFVLLSADGAGGCSADYSADPDTVFADIVPGPVLSLATLDTLCGAGTTDLTTSVQLSGDPNATVTFHTGLPPTPGNEIPGTAVAVNSDTVFFALATNATICADTLAIPVTIDNPDFGLTAQVITNYNGFDVSCPGSADGASQATVEGGNLGYTFRWSDGSTGSVVTDLAAGSYTVTATSPGGCEQIDSVRLTAPDSIRVDIEPVSPPCPGDSTATLVINSISGGAPPYTYSLEGMAFVPVGNFPFPIPALPPGTQPLWIEDGNGCGIQTDVSIPGPGSQVLELGEDETIQQGDSVQLRPVINFEPLSIQWTPVTGLSDSLLLAPFASPARTTTYQLEARTPNGCLLSDQITVEVIRIRQLYLPNAFSPNEDGRNDFFFPQGRAFIQVEEFQVFDRWGDRMFVQTDFAPNDPSAGWNGQVRGKDAPSGLYVYYLKVRYPDGETEVLGGDVMLLR